MMMDSSVDENTMADGTATIKVIGVAIPSGYRTLKQQDRKAQ